MRPDIAKVITERPRVGMRLKQPKSYRKEMKITDDSPKGEKIRLKWKSHYSEGKEFSEKLGPLKRFLLSKVGQSWNDVYSELRQGLDMGNIVQKHVMTHVYQYVELDVYLAVDGNYYGGAPYFHKVDFLYVDPETGILCKVPEEKKRIRYKHTIPDLIEVSENIIYKKIDGIWYELEVKPIPKITVHRQEMYSKAQFLRKYEEYVNVHDVAYNKDFNNYNTSDARKLYGKTVYATKKRQLNTKEIKQLAA